MMTRPLLLGAALVTALAAPAFAGPGKDQIAAGLGVDPNLYSLSELVRLDQAHADDDRELIDFITGGGLAENRAGVSERVTPAMAQLASALGVDARDYTLAELVRLDAVANDRFGD